MLVRCDGLLSTEQCAQLIALGAGRMQPSTISGRLVRVRSAARTSDSIYLEGEIPALQPVRAFVLELLSVQPAQLEPWELVRYGVGSRYTRHRDALSAELHPAAFARGGQRTHSVLVYLSEVLEGGATLFPTWKRRIIPRPGRVVVWPNDRNSWHEGAPVLEGEKWIVTTRVRERPFAEAG